MAPLEPPLIRQQRLEARKRRLITIGIGIVLAPLAVLAVMWLAAFASQRAREAARASDRPICCDHVDEAGVAYNTVSLGRTDTRFYPSWNSAAILVLFDPGGDIEEQMTEASALAYRGYGVLVIGQEHRPLEDVIRAALTHLEGEVSVNPSRVGVLARGVDEQAILEIAAPRPVLVGDSSTSRDEVNAFFDSKLMGDMIGLAESEADAILRRGYLTPTRTPDKWGFPNYEDVTLTTLDGLTLKGWYIPSSNGAAIILLHGYMGNRLTGMQAIATTLAEAGYGVLMYDRRAHGESGGDQRSWGWLDVPDVGVALDYLLAHNDVDPDRIGILGFSMGGQIAIRAAAEYEVIGAVFADGACTVAAQDAAPLASEEDHTLYAYTWAVIHVLEEKLGMPHPPLITEVIGDIAPRPLFLLATGDDYEYPDARWFYEHAGEPKTLWFVPEALHGGTMGVRPDEYKQTLLSFFGRALLGEP